VDILRGVSFQVDAGEIFGFLGPNGAGKTTTMKCILGLLRPDSGTIEIFRHGYDRTDVRTRVGFLPEYPYFYEYLSGPELLRFSARLFPVATGMIEARIQVLMKMVGLEGVGSLKLKKYSKGMVQRIGLAQALINDPDLVMLDEPFSGLDPIGRKELRDIVFHLKDAGKTVFFSSHILQDMEMIVDKVGIIFKGRILKQGRLTDLVTEYIHSFEIVFTGVAEDKIRTRLGIPTRQDDNQMVRTRGIEEMNQAVDFIRKNHGRILSVTPVRKTLEDIFLEEIQR